MYCLKINKNLVRQVGDQATVMLSLCLLAINDSVNGYLIRTRTYMHYQRKAEELKIVSFFLICVEPNRLAQNRASVKHQSGRILSAHRIIVMYVTKNYCKFK
jgi:hypothetical protein